MPAQRANYIVAFKGLSQIYSTLAKEKALETPPPAGLSLEDKMIFFISWEPDNEDLIVRRIPHDEVLNAEILEPKPKKKKTDEQEQESIPADS